MRKLLAEWIRLHRKGAAIGLQRAPQVYEAIQRAYQARADREILARLDARTLRDIGLDSWNASLVERVEVRRQQQLLRLAAARIGMY
jgi:predicted lipid-binding transport protein (Tim44 family)